MTPGWRDSDRLGLREHFISAVLIWPAGRERVTFFQLTFLQLAKMYLYFQVVSCTSSYFFFFLQPTDASSAMAPPPHSQRPSSAGDPRQYPCPPVSSSGRAHSLASPSARAQPRAGYYGQRTAWPLLSSASLAVSWGWSSVAVTSRGRWVWGRHWVTGRGTLSEWVWRWAGPGSVSQWTLT